MDINSDFEQVFTESPDPEPRCIVRLSRSTWHTSRGLFSTTSLQYLKLQCVGFNLLHEDCSMIDADAVFTRIVNVTDCIAGTYQVVPCNESRDWESGHIDDYGYKLIPFVK